MELPVAEVAIGDVAPQLLDFRIRKIDGWASVVANVNYLRVSQAAF